MRYVRQVMAAVMVMAIGMSTAPAAVKPTTKTKDLPQIWADAGPQERLKAVRVAELDAMRLLIERIYGIELASGTTVYDLILSDDTVRSDVVKVIKGVTTTEEPEYLEDGSVQVVRAVKLRQVLETITKTVKKKNLFGRLITISDIETVEIKNQDTVIDVMGNGALPESKGYRKILAKRAAEVDAYRKLAERLKGVSVTSSTTVQDFVLKSDIIRARVAQFVKGAKPVAITYAQDDSCEVEMQIKIADIFEIIKKYSTVDKEVVKYEKEYATTAFTEKGRGAPRPVKDEAIAASAPVSEMQALDGAYQETEIIIKRLVGQGIVVD